MKTVLLATWQKGEEIMKKVIMMMLAVILAMAMLVGCGATDSNAPADDGNADMKVYELKASSGDNEDYPTVIALYKFAELLEEKSEGRITVDVYAGGALYGDQREEAEAVKNGTIAFSVPQVSVLSTWAPEMDFFSMPYLLTSIEHAETVLDSDVAVELFGKLNEYGFEVLAPFTGGGMRSFYNSKQPIETADDLKGMKFRTPSSAILNEAMGELGAIPTPVSWGELYTTLMQKGVDGAEHGATDVYGSNFFEACKYYSLDEHTYELIPLIVGTSTMESLPADLQEVVRACAKEALVYNRQVAKEQTDTAIAGLVENGMVINEVDKSSFIAAVEATNQKYADQLGRNYYDAIVAMGS